MKNQINKTVDNKQCSCNLNAILSSSSEDTLLI